MPRKPKRPVRGGLPEVHKSPQSVSPESLILERLANLEANQQHMARSADLLALENKLLWWIIGVGAAVIVTTISSAAYVTIRFLAS